MRTILLLSGSLTLAACAPAAPLEGPAPESVEFTLTTCFGACPDFTVVINSNGQGSYTGRQWVAQQGEHSFTASPEEVSAFFRRIAPFRPDGEVGYGHGNCPGAVATDMPSVNVTWTGASGTDSLDWYRGCRVAELQAIEPNLYDAWQELPLDELVGTDENRFKYRARD